MADRAETLTDVPTDRAGERGASGQPGAGRPMPLMQVVTKGWWTLRHESASVEELRKEDRDERRGQA